MSVLILLVAHSRLVPVDRAGRTSDVVVGNAEDTSGKKKKSSINRSGWKTKKGEGEWTRTGTREELLVFVKKKSRISAGRYSKGYL